MVPTNFAIANDRVLAGLDPAGLRHVVYESGLVPSDREAGRGAPSSPGWNASAPWTRASSTARTWRSSPAAGWTDPDADFYAAASPACPGRGPKMVESRPFFAAGRARLVLHHPWDLEAVWTLRIRRPEGAPPFLVSRLPEGFVRPGTRFPVAWVPREAADRKPLEVRLDPGGRLVPVSDTGRRLARYFRHQPALPPHRAGSSSEAHLAAAGGPRGPGVEVYRWRPSSFLPPRSPDSAALSCSGVSLGCLPVERPGLSQRRWRRARRS